MAWCAVLHCTIIIIAALSVHFVLALRSPCR